MVIFLKLVQFISSLFKKEEVKKTETQPETTGHSTTGKKIAIIVGHSESDCGAEGACGINEFDYNKYVAEKLKSLVKKNHVDVLYRGSLGIVGVAMKAVSLNPDAIIELHCNAFDGSAYGCEVLVLESKKGTEAEGLALNFAMEINKRFGHKIRRDRGIKWITSGDRGNASLNSTSSIEKSILVEPFFIDNKNDNIDKEEYASFLASWIDNI